MVTTIKKVNTPITKKEKDEQHRFFFWYKDENKAWIKKTLNKLGREDLLSVLLPERTEKWQKNKPSGEAKNTFNDAVPFNQRKSEDKVRFKKKRTKKKKRR